MECLAMQRPRDVMTTADVVADEKTGGVENGAPYDVGEKAPDPPQDPDNPLKDFTDHLKNEGWRDKLKKRFAEKTKDEISAELMKSVTYLNIAEGGPVQHKGTGFIYDELFTRHKCEWDPQFPECPERILQAFNRCQELGLVKRCTRIPIQYAKEEQIQWHHSPEHVRKLRSTATMTKSERMDEAKRFHQWYSNEATNECSFAAVGSCIELMDQIVQKEVTNGFAMVRPPGHHAMREEFCGYCVLNNVAFAATHALNSGMERVLIVDWDVHHGQGTQDMFYDDPRVMYFSIHRYEHGEFWPKLRRSDYDFIGTGRGKGYNVNVPLNRAGLGDSDYMAIMQQLLMPLAYEFKPEAIVISCGLDAAIGDEKGEMMVSPAAYAHFVHMLSGLCEGRVCTVLEGGYCLQSLAEGCAMTVRTLLGDPCPQLPPLSEPSDSVINSILNVIKVLRPYWQCFNTFGILEDGKQCQFEDVNTLPPKGGVVFATKENHPSEHDIMGHFPKQSQETMAMFKTKIDQLIAETSLTKPPNRTCLAYDGDMTRHRNLIDVTHPERPKRITSIFQKICEWGLQNRCLQLQPRRATKEEILAVHNRSYFNTIEETADMTEGEVFQRQHDLNFTAVYLSRDTYDCAMLSAGCLLQATEAVLSGQAQNAVAVIRPPGHHAERDQANGFCIFNNVAVAATYAKDKFGVKRVLIVDWDVHHGNGTQHIFYDDPSVLCISLHRYETNFFPNHPDAEMQHTGEGEGEGFNVNIPWVEDKMGDAEYMAAFHRIVMPIAYEFGPELVLVCAGFDAAEGDLLGRNSVMPECFGHMTHMLSSLASGRVVMALEGGYNLLAISLSVATCTSVLLGDPCPLLVPGIPKDSACSTIREVLEVQKKYWKSLKFAVDIPGEKLGPPSQN